MLPLQQHDALVIGAQSQLTLRTEHPLAVLPADLALPDPESTGKDRAHRSEGVVRAHAHHRGTAHHRNLAVRARHPAQGQPVRVGVRAGFQHATDDDVLQPLGQIDHLFHGRPAQREPLHRLGRAESDARSHIADPAVGHLHRNCPRKRMSFS